MTTLERFSELGRSERGLTVVSTLRSDGSIQASVVNAGVMAHPETGVAVVAFVTYGRTKLSNLRARPQITLTVRSGWEWATVEGRAELAGPDDRRPWLDEEGRRTLLRDVFKAAGGQHEDWDEYDQVMREQRRTAVLTTVDRVYSNPR